MADTVRIVGQPQLHRRGRPTDDPNVWRTPCGIRYIPAPWPWQLARAPLPRCAVCS